ncbi:unnamed protein product [Calypogeia fissa]
MYMGQLQEIKRLLRPRIYSRLTVKPISRSYHTLSEDSEAAEEINLPRVSSVDDYQGEESDIIILSLVRNNSIVTNAGIGKIGFLDIPNRICVALTRARKGLFIFGNADLLAANSPLWNDVTTSMRNSGELGSHLELYCQNHPEIITSISTAEDFKQVEDGGCSLPCDIQLRCGHACPRRCHPGSHYLIVCPKPCLREREDCPHSCNLRCHGFKDCPPCSVIVTKKLLNCEHLQGVQCSKDLSEETANTDVKGLVENAKEGRFTFHADRNVGVSFHVAMLAKLGALKPVLHVPKNAEKAHRKCGHRCIGLCGEPCPKKCRVCHPEALDIITLMMLEEYEESDRFVQLQDCSHVFEVTGLDSWMDSNETAREDGSVAIKLKECPECKTLVWRTHRYSNVVKTKHAQVEAVKEKMLGYDLAKKGDRLLQQGQNKGAIYAFLQALQQNPDLMEVQFGIGRAFFAEGEYDKAITHLSLVVERSSFAPSLAKHITSAHLLCNTSGLLEKLKHYRKSSRKVGDAIAVQALVQWASAHTQRKEFTSAIELCDAVLGRDPQNQLAKELSEKAKKGEVQLVVQAMAADVGERGHWYTCPNGHLYTIADCGGAMQLSKCPDCKADVGGEQHKLTAGNRHSNIDGSESAAWPPGN